MSEGAQPEITDLLRAWEGGRPEALDQLMPLVYEELRRLAHHSFRAERRDHTLQTSDLIHEAFLRLIEQDRVHWKNRGHFFAIASRMMRRVLVDQARANRAAKRGHGLRVPLDTGKAPSERQDLDLIALDLALVKLHRIDERQCRIVELRYFGGFTIEETASLLAVSVATIKRDWMVAKAWLYGEVKGAKDGSSPFGSI